MTCNMIGFSHCGRELQPSDVAQKCAAHINYGDKPHEWRTLYQCHACASKDAELEMQCNPLQETWRERRRACDLSQGEFARLVGLSTSVYSRLEHKREPAPPNVVSVIERVLNKHHRS